MGNDQKISLHAPANESYTRKAGLLPEPVSLESYRSQAFYELERDRVFGRSWLTLAREEELPEPGDYLVRDIEVLGASVIVARGRDGTIRSFHNVCSHRANQVAWERSGNATRLVCRYHNWTYRTDGRLIGVPDEASFERLDKAKCGLTPIATEVWEGFIFVNLERNPSVRLEEFLGGMGDYLKGIQYKYADNPITIEAHLDCNWKVACDAFSEAYHIPAIHANTIGKTFSSQDNKFAHILGANFFGPHRSAALYGNPDYIPGEEAHVERLAYSAIDSANVVAAGSREEMADYLAHPAVNHPKAREWVHDVHAIFPNLHIDTGQGGFYTHHFWPTSVNTTRYEVRFYMAHALDARARFQQEAYLARVMEVLLEDLSNVKRTQRGIDSGGKDYMVLQENEVMIRHSVHHVERWARAQTVQEALA
ncbi:aromatic ring-hydroxylating oxygenase subunit alpha [Sphingosinicella soli]|uniref:Phenylpropionate dioxygenase-like ring-hydroxylating dioxygenase large terminal subunit n=1 Tax=Sphingosinicella soli TaxID=333708 RepID=A0A7W7B061_9SPHN|nr:aromatic ring-hydroxylating dioxygenase subunit alpha [Sphingosinicella soli]MBB4631616.1 phenylpropionate dioxygenase-like ring-hydroxylating dioxygenase large terminal subunit [Sphingosinicella soli]